MKIRTMQIGRINRADYNPRVELKPGDPVYGKLRSSIQAFGFCEPLVFNRRTGHLVGGHQRLAVLKDLGYAETEVVVVDLPLEQEKALNVALNKVPGGLGRAETDRIAGRASGNPGIRRRTDRL